MFREHRGKGNLGLYGEGGRSGGRTAFGFRPRNGVLVAIVRRGELVVAIAECNAESSDKTTLYKIGRAHV